MKPQELAVLIDGRTIGHVRQNLGRLRFRYEDDWRSDRQSFALSLSMPLTAAEHPHKFIDAFLWGLLPDNADVLDRWAKQFHVSARNPFALIAHVGEECAGAVQFATAHRAVELSVSRALEVDWLDTQQIAQRLRALRDDHAAWRSPADIGQFSLAGAQPKTAFFRDAKGRWGVPAGRTPTTHILKPATGRLEGQVENEHMCLTLAHALGLPTATSTVMRFDTEIAIVIERYDRITEQAAPPKPANRGGSRRSKVATTPRVLRVHQEDMCQALGVGPTLKYQNEGGPSPEDIVSLLQTHSSRPDEDIRTFIDALALSWLIGGTDAHAKNYSLLHGARGALRLAPLYDVASILPYTDVDPKRVKLAMKIGGEYRMHAIGARQWRKLSVALRLDPNETLGRITALAARVAVEVVDVRRQLRRDGLRHAILDKLATVLVTRAHACAAELK